MSVVYFYFIKFNFVSGQRQIDLLLHVIQKTVDAATYWKIHTKKKKKMNVKITAWKTINNTTTQNMNRVSRFFLQM